MAKIKIVLDADIIIHFAKGEYLSSLPKIFAEYDYIILDKVYEEIKGKTKVQVDNQINLLKNIRIVQFNPTNIDIRREYATLIQTLGKGETASMLYCKENKDVVASSNLKDIKDYCNKHKITYITTLDFIYHAAIIRKLITIKEANAFIQAIKDKGSKLPMSITDISAYLPEVIL